jgi:hypothetical protein
MRGWRIAARWFARVSLVPTRLPRRIRWEASYRPDMRATFVDPGRSLWVIRRCVSGAVARSSYSNAYPKARRCRMSSARARYPCSFSFTPTGLTNGAAGYCTSCAQGNNLAVTLTATTGPPGCSWYGTGSANTCTADTWVWTAAGGSWNLSYKAGGITAVASYISPGWNGWSTGVFSPGGSDTWCGTYPASLSVSPTNCCGSVPCSVNSDCDACCGIGNGLCGTITPATAHAAGEGLKCHPGVSRKVLRFRAE